MRCRVVLFDLDGTLIDSVGVILSSFHHATSKVLGRRLEDHEILQHVGGLPLEAHMAQVDPVKAGELVAEYRAHYGLRDLKLRFHGGVELAVRALIAEGRELGVVSSKRRQTVDATLRALGAEELFPVTVGSDDTEYPKPSPDPLLTAIERFGARPEDAAYVGDSPFDIRAAKAAGMYAVAVAWGGIHADDVLQREQPDAFVRHAEELLGVL